MKLYAAIHMEQENTSQGLLTTSLSRSSYSLVAKMLEKVSKDFEWLHADAFAFTGHQLVDYPEQTWAAEAKLSQLCTG